MIHPAAASDSATQPVLTSGRQTAGGAETTPPPLTADDGAATGRHIARAAIMAVIGLVLMLPAIAVMPRFGQWMTDHGPFAVMLPFMLWMMLAGGLLFSGAMKIIAAARA